MKNTLLAALLLAALPAAAHAYLDPGTGSYAYQVIIAAALGAAFSIKIFFKDIKRRLQDFFGRKDR